MLMNAVLNLTHLIQYFREKIRASSFIWSNSLSPIQQLQLGCPQRALKLAQQLREQSIICLPSGNLP